MVFILQALFEQKRLVHLKSCTLVKFIHDLFFQAQPEEPVIVMRYKYITKKYKDSLNHKVNEFTCFHIFLVLNNSKLEVTEF